MMSPIPIGIAGAGFAARFHLENLPESGVAVVGVTSARAESRETFAAQHGLRVFRSVEEMLPEIDLLDICTPPSSHRDYILAAAKAGKHVVVEKPLSGFYGSPGRYDKRHMLAAVVEEAGRLQDAVRQAGIMLGYAENFVYAPPSRRSGRSWKRPARKSCGWWARNRTTARTRRSMASGASREAGRSSPRVATRWAPCCT